MFNKHLTSLSCSGNIVKNRSLYAEMQESHVIRQGLGTVSVDTQAGLVSFFPLAVKH